MDPYIQDESVHEAPAHLSTPVQGYLDDSFIDRTAPRLKGVPLTGASLGEKPQNYVPTPGAVIPEVLIQQRVIGPKGRDYNAVVSVIVPDSDKVVSTLEISREKAGAVADLLADAIAATAFANRLMIPEGQGRGQGIPVDSRNPLGGLGWPDPLSPEGFAEMMQAFASSPLDPLQTVPKALELIVEGLPEGPKKEKAKASLVQFKEIMKKAMTDIEAVLKEITSEPENENILKDEAFDTQSAFDSEIPPSDPQKPT